MPQRYTFFLNKQNKKWIFEQNSIFLLRTARFALLPHRDMEAGLLVFVFDVDTACTLFVEQYLPQD